MISINIPPNIGCESFLETIKELVDKGVNNVTVTDADPFLKQLFHAEIAETPLEDLK